MASGGYGRVDGYEELAGKVFQALKTVSVYGQEVI